MENEIQDQEKQSEQLASVNTVQETPSPNKDASPPTDTEPSTTAPASEQKRPSTHDHRNSNDSERRPAPSSDTPHTHTHRPEGGHEGHPKVHRRKQDISFFREMRNDFSESGGRPPRPPRDEKTDKDWFSRSPRNRYYKRRIDKIEAHNLQIDYKYPDVLRRFISEKGKILPRHITGTSARNQRRLVREIKRSRHLALLPPG